MRGSEVKFVRSQEVVEERREREGVGVGGGGIGGVVGGMGVGRLVGVAVVGSPFTGLIGGVVELWGGERN